jgi:hypothetical protein|uniref:Uncharacterized protein n=1 Tax=Siphoviridae sp. ctlwB1 TaxID=2826449 RepID=A0A8S5NEA5_9CAUD|nr:MAG TPA: hypothetical protein [Siphoviridae sp. ctlwB1]
MGAIGLNPIRLDRIGLDPIRINAIKLGVPGAASGTNRPYIDPEVLASLKAVCICYGKSNDDPDRAVVKNLVDPDNPFVISNAAYEGMSGYNGYPVVFGANKTWANESNGYVTSITSNTIHITNVLNAGLALLYSYVKYNGNLQNIKEIPPFKIEIKGLEGRSKFIYKYLATSDATKETNLYLENGTHELPKSFLPTEALINDAVVGFSISPIEEGVTNFLSDITIKVLPEYEGAFVTDGVDDLITSTKTVQEMLGGSNELTIVSMVHQVKDSANNVSFTNYIRGSANGYFRNIVNNYDKTGIYGYTSSDLKGLSVVNNILGDKNDYTSNGDNRDSIINGNFSVQGYSYNDGNNTGDFSSVAWYWTIIANKVLTTDQINQVIAYYNLDKWVTPDILYDVKKQGITNENHAEFNDKLIDYSGNGRDIQLNNIAWKGDSGIGKYETDFTKWLLDQVVDITRKYSSFNIKTKNDSRVNSWVVRAQDTVIPSMKVKVTGISSSVESLIYRYSVIDDKDYYIDITSDGIYELPQTNGKGWEGFRIVGKNFNISVEQIPSHAGALCLDGVNDFGKVTGMPIYKDYTVIADYERFYLEPITGGRASILSKSSKVGDGSFIFNLENQDGGKACYTFGEANGNISDDITRIIRYQSKYYNTKTLSIGTAEDNDFMVLGKVREVDSRYFCGAIYSLMSFPYSMSEFLIERQLKKHKLGTLYPDMVEFRPIVKSNLPYSSISYSVNPGEYISVDSMVTITVTLPNTSDKLMEVSCNAISDISISGDNGVYEITGKIVKSPQKINLVISSYLTMLNNETLISNETLIKNE